MKNGLGQAGGQMPVANLEKSHLDDDGEPGGVVGGFDAGTVRTGVGGWRRAASRWRRQNGRHH